MKDSSLKELYSQNVNIMKWFRDSDNEEHNSLESILYSYDLQAGSYVDLYNSDVVSECLVDGLPKKIKSSEITDLRSEDIAKVLNNLSYQSFLDVGIGEATSMVPLITKLTCKNVDFFGIDISLSRLLYANEFINKNHDGNIQLAVANMFSLPFQDSSIDIVFTSHAIEPNTSKSKDALLELYRVCSKYLVIIEPSFDLGNSETKSRIKAHAYIDDLHDAMLELDFNIIEHRLLNSSSFHNNSAITVVKKMEQNDIQQKVTHVCPNCINEVSNSGELLFCDACGLLYPIVNKIPILTKENAVLCTHFNHFCK